MMAMATTTTTTTRETTMRIERPCVNGVDHAHVGVHVHVHVNLNVDDHDHVDVNDHVNVNGHRKGDGDGSPRVNGNAHSGEVGCGTERDKLRGRVDHASAGRGDGTALHRDTAVNGRAMDRIPAERERVLAFSSLPRTAHLQGAR
jgi:hypothetical protein